MPEIRQHRRKAGAIVREFGAAPGLGELRGVARRLGARPGAPGPGGPAAIDA
jgi:hypothetical protein